ncbi:MAG: radical SAM protein [Lentisphaerae bacterium]|nr:radical SAM protein [Lentisphaerota bacterium]
MDCDALSGWSEDFLNRLNSEGRRLCIPMTGSMALTHRCNLRCAHCYAGPDMDPQSPGMCGEPSTERWLSLIDEVAAAGCLFLLLTGGEPMVRPDFAQIYRHAKEAGLLVTVFTNGTMLTDKILDLFDELPPHAVEISLYGATAATHDGIAGIPGAFDWSIAAVEKLLARGNRLRLKSVLMKPNLEEFPAIRALAEETYGVDFRMDAAIMPRLDGDTMPLQLRVSPETAADMEMSHPETRRKWAKAKSQSAHVTPSPRLYSCGAGVIGFHIDAEAQLLPCLITTNVAVDVSTKPFAEGWSEIVEIMAGLKAKTGLECQSCPHSVMCGQCPSYALMENGQADSVPEYLCELGRCRRERLERCGD